MIATRTIICDVSNEFDIPITQPAPDFPSLYDTYAWVKSTFPSFPFPRANRFASALWSEQRNREQKMANAQRNG